MRSLISFYLESAVSGRKIMASTAPQMAEKLERILAKLESGYGVAVGDDKITGLSPITLQRWFNSESARWKPGTSNNYISIINPFLRFCTEMGMLPYLENGKTLGDVLHTAKLPSPDELPPDQRPKDKYYTHEEARALLNGVTGYNHLRDRAIMALILYGGFRVSEICALTIAQVMDVPRGSIRLRRKGGAWKDAEVSLDAYPYLEAYLATRSDAADRRRPLFITTHGQPCTRQQLYKALAPKQKALDLATGPHALRHTAVSEVNNRFGALAARDFANHKSMHVTDRYSHTTEAQRRAAADGLRWN